MGGSATSDNITPLNLINIRRVAWGIRELEDLRGKNPAPPRPGNAKGSTLAQARQKPAVPAIPLPAGGTFSPEDIEAITRAVMAKLGG